MIKFRRLGRTANTIGETAAFLIRLGRRIPHGEKTRPQSLPGFMILRGSKVGDEYPIAFDLMESLGFSRAKVEKAAKNPRAAVPGDLPESLRAVVRFNAVYDSENETWTFPGTFDDRLAMWDGHGLFCTGDGDKARRRNDQTGVASVIDCNPLGKPDVETCPYSRDSRCKAEGKLIVWLAVESGREAGPKYLPLTGDMTQMFELTTRSDVGLMQIGEEFRRVAVELNGQIEHLSGTLQVQMRERRLPPGQKATKTVVPVVSFRFDPVEVRARRQAIGNLYLVHDKQVEPFRIEEAAQPAGVPVPASTGPSTENVIPEEHKSSTVSNAPDASQMPRGDPDFILCRPSENDDEPVGPVGNSQYSGPSHRTDSPRPEDEVSQIVDTPTVEVDQFETMPSETIVGALEKFIFAVSEEKDEPPSASGQRILAIKFDGRSVTFTKPDTLLGEGRSEDQRARFRTYLLKIARQIDDKRFSSALTASSGQEAT